MIQPNLIALLYQGFDCLISHTYIQRRHERLNVCSNRARYNNSGYDGSYRNSGTDQEDDISKKSDGSPYDAGNLEKVESERRGSAVFRATMNEGLVLRGP